MTDASSHGWIVWSILLGFTLLRGMLQALAVIYPSYKTFKAIESRSLRAAQGMLVYWCIQGAVNALKEFLDPVLGTFSSFFVWKLFILGLKLAPLAAGPDRLYDLLVKPVFEATEPGVDAVVEEAHKLKSIAKDAVPAVKSGDAEQIKAKGAEILGTVKEDAVALASNVKESLVEKQQEVKLAFDKEGIMGVLDMIVAKFEVVRDVVVNVLGGQWEQHGPMIKKQSAQLTDKSIKLYQTHGPVIKQKAVDTYTTQIAPRIQPAVQFASTQTAKVNQLWIEKGGPVRSFTNEKVLPFYRTQFMPFVNNKALPLWQNKIDPFLRHALLPAVYETIVSIKDRLVDLIISPTDDVKTQRAHSKKLRKEKSEARASASWKRRGDKLKKKWDSRFDAFENEDEQKSVKKDSPALAEGKAELKNRKTHEVVDSTLDASAEVFHPINESTESAPSTKQQWAISKAAGIPHEAGQPHIENFAPALAADTKLTPEVSHKVEELGINTDANKLGADLGEKNEAFANEPKSGNRTEVL